MRVDVIGRKRGSKQSEKTGRLLYAIVGEVK
jgi:hypothetical protein